MRTRDTLWFGFLLGALLGPLVLWILAILSLMLPAVEALAQPIFAFSRMLGGLLAPSGSAGDGTVAVLWIIHGVLFGIVGVIVQWVRRGLRQRA